MGDPLADPRAADLLAAVPDEVGVVAADFRMAAAEAAATALGLSAARRDGTWMGRAADAFRRAIGRLPAELDRLSAGFSEVATALTAYEAELARIRPAFRHTTAELADTQSRLAAARVADPALESERARLTTRAFELLDYFSAARDACRSTIAAAEATAPARPLLGGGITVIDTAARVR